MKLIAYVKNEQRAKEFAKEIITKDLKNPNLKIKSIKKIRFHTYEIIIGE